MEASQPSPSSCFHSVLQLSTLTAATIPDSRELAGPNSVVSVLDYASSSSIESWSMTTDTEHEAAAAETQSSVIRLRGCPFNCDVDAIRAFFHPAELSEVYFCRRDGRATGEAYVVLAPAANPQAVLSQLDKKYIGNRYIELFEASAADLRAVKKMLEDRSLQGYVVRLRGLPYTATEADVRGFMDGVQLSNNPDCIVFAHAPNGRPTGEAYVELANEQALTLAMTRHKEVMGTRYIEVFNSSKMDKVQAQKQLEGLSSPGIDSSSRWVSTAMPHSSAFVGHRPLPAAVIQQRPMRQQLQPVHMQHYMSADNLANQLAAQCQVAAGHSRMQHVLSPVSQAIEAAAAMPAAIPAAVSTAAYPPPGLQALQQVQASQPGLLQQHAHMLPPVSSTQGMGAVAAACAGLNQASMQMVQLMPQQTLPGMQGMMPAGLNFLQDDGLAGPPACGYQPVQHVSNPLLLQNQVLPPNGYHNLPGMSSVGVLEGCKQLQQLPSFTSGPMSPLPAMPQGAPAGRQMQHLAGLPAAQQMLQQGWGAPGMQATLQDSGMGWQQAHLRPY